MVTKARSLRLLRWTLATVLGVSALLVPVTQVAHHTLASPLPVIAAAEVLGAVLLLVPRSIRAGGWVLLATVLAASAFHLSRREAPPAAFAVYLAALLAVMADARAAETGGR